MPATALALVLVAALLHATWNLAAKKAGGDQRFALVGALMVAVLWAAPALWFAGHELAHWGPLELGLVLASAVVHLLYFNVLLTGYRHADLTVVYPVTRGSAPLLSAAAAVLLLGETLSALGLAGVLAVCAGVFLIAGGPALLQRSQAAGRSAGVLTGLRRGLLAGAFVASYTVIDAYAVKVLLISPVLLDWLGNLLRIPFLLPAAVRDPAGFKQALRAQWRYALVVAVLGPLGYIMVLYAVTLAPLSHVAPARECSMLLAALLGGRLLGEADRGPRLLGAALVAGGVAALALG